MSNKDKVILCIGLLFSIILIFIAICLETYKCKIKANIQEMESSFGILQGCMVKQKDGKWIEYKHLRQIQN